MTRKNNELTIKKKKDKPYTQYVVSVVSDTFIRRFADKTNITLKDSHYILQTVNKMLAESLIAGESICFPGAGTINVRNTGKRQMYTPIINNGKGGYIEKNNFYRFSFSPSQNVKEAIYFDEDKIIDQYKLETED